MPVPVFHVDGHYTRRRFSTTMRPRSTSKAVSSNMWPLVMSGGNVPTSGPGSVGEVQNSTTI